MFGNWWEQERKKYIINIKTADPAGTGGIDIAKHGCSAEFERKIQVLETVAQGSRKCGGQRGSQA